MPDATSSTDSLHNVIPRLVYDAREQEDRAEAVERELAATRVRLAAVERAYQTCVTREMARVQRLLCFGCRDCGTDGEKLCAYCIQPLCQECIQDDEGGAHLQSDEIIESITNSYVCSLCNNE